MESRHLARKVVFTRHDYPSAISVTSSSANFSAALGACRRAQRCGARICALHRVIPAADPLTARQISYPRSAANTKWAMTVMCRSSGDPSKETRRLLHPRDSTQRASSALSIANFSLPIRPSLD